jgi:hypothetical protein
MRDKGEAGTGPFLRVRYAVLRDNLNKRSLVSMGRGAKEYGSTT